MFEDSDLLDFPVSVLAKFGFSGLGIVRLELPILFELHPGFLPGLKLARIELPAFGILEFGFPVNDVVTSSRTRARSCIFLPLSLSCALLLLRRVDAANINKVSICFHFVYHLVCVKEKD